MVFMPPPGPSPGPQAQQPTSPPPPFIPPRPASFAVDPGAIAGCLFRNTYV
jgi:hypothetical protein